MGLERGDKRPVHWTESKIHVIYSLALLGATEAQMADILEVDLETIKYWKRTKPEFLQALNQGKLGADAKVVEAFYRCAIGFDYEEEESRVIRGELKTVKVNRKRPPDAWAAAKWLSLRQRQMWSETQRIEINQTNTNINVDWSDLTFEQLKLLKEISDNKRLSAGSEDTNI